MLFEATIGLIAHSLALLSDAAHMLTDPAAIGLSLVAIRLAVRGARRLASGGGGGSKLGPECAARADLVLS